MIISRGFVRAAGRDVHYRTAGAGPTVVLLHDSPRSSFLHEPLITALADRFEVIALDTPGYGESDALAKAAPSIADFGQALLATIDALGVERAAFYGFHTSAKILLDLAVRAPDRISLAILDGLSIPVGPPDETFIADYMRPFEVDNTGAWLAREWTRVLDTRRWFPWFRPTTTTRMPSPAPSIQVIHDYALDYFLAGPAYAAAYGAAMRHDPTENLRRVSASTVLMARSNDVLFSHLDRLPADAADVIRVERLTPDTAAWTLRLREHFETAATNAGPRAGASAVSAERGYLNLAHGQVMVRRHGAGEGRPVILLHDAPGSSAGDLELLETMGQQRLVFAIDLPGCGGSDPLPIPDGGAYLSALSEVIEALAPGGADLVAEGFATPFAIALAGQRPDLVGALVLDGVELADGQTRDLFRREAQLSLTPERSGAHWLRAWHMMRDREAQYPWWSGSVDAIRLRTPDLDPQRLRRLTLDLMRRPDHWADAFHAALEIDAAEALSKVSAPILLPCDDGDPRQAQWMEVGALGVQPTLVERADTAAGRAAQYLVFLDAN